MQGLTNKWSSVLVICYLHWAGVVMWAELTRGSLWAARAMLWHVELLQLSSELHQAWLPEVLSHFIPFVTLISACVTAQSQIHSATSWGNKGHDVCVIMWYLWWIYTKYKRHLTSQHSKYQTAPQVQKKDVTWHKGDLWDGLRWVILL